MPVLLRRLRASTDITSNTRTRKNKNLDVFSQVCRLGDTWHSPHQILAIVLNNKFFRSLRLMFRPFLHRFVNGLPHVHQGFEHLKHALKSEEQKF